MPDQKTEALALGIKGEDAAAAYLIKQGLKIIHRGYRTTRGEIDLVCREGDVWVFVEVKSRLHVAAISAVDAITPAKQKKTVGAALSYLKRYGIKDQSVRFDVITIEAGQLNWIPGAFEPTVAYTY
jgi:putative endonuclease